MEIEQARPPRKVDPQRYGGGIFLAARPDPFTAATRQQVIEAGHTIGEIVETYSRKTKARTRTHVWIDGHKVAPGVWHCVKPKPGTAVTLIQTLPRGGGGGKNPIAAILSIALSIAAPGLGTALADAIGFSGIIGIEGAGYLISGATIMRGVISLVGMLAINALAPPAKKQSGVANAPTLFIQGARNTVAQYGVIPKAYGTVLWVPPYGAAPYTETVGSDQYVRGVFLLGYGPLNIRQMRFGQTLLADFDAVDVEVRQGFDNDPPLTLYPDQVIENDLSIVIKHDLTTITSDSISITAGNTVNLPADHGLEYAVGSTVEMSGWAHAANNSPTGTSFTIATAATNSFTTVEALTAEAAGRNITVGITGYNYQTTQPNINEISIDLTFPRGLAAFNSSGGKSALTVQVEIQYAPTGTTNWSNAAGTYTAYAAQDVSAIKVPSAGSCWYRVYIDPASGNVGYAQGAATIHGSAPELPLIPTGALPIARILRAKGDPAVIPAGSLFDERNPGDVGDYFETAGDFAPTTSGSNNTIHLAAGGLAYPGLKITAAQTSALRKEIRFSVPWGQYDVRVRRITADSDPNNDKIMDEVDWTALRSIRTATPINKKGMALVAYRIKATDQLNGAPDQFNCITDSILPDWDGTSWGDRSDQSTWVMTNNIPAIYRDILQGSANAKAIPDSRVDVTGLQGWHDRCIAANRFYNGVFDTQGSVQDGLQQVASLGRAAPALNNGLWGVVEDLVRTVIVQHFTPRNSWGFQGNKAFVDLPTALRCQFVNADNNYQPDEIVAYDDGYSVDGSVPGTVAATSDQYQALQLPGVTSSTQAWGEGRYHMASARERPETYVFNADFENIVCTRGDLIRFTHDVTEEGVGSARVSNVTAIAGNIVSVDVDDTLVMADGTSYGVRFRKSDGTSIVHPVNTVNGENTTLVFADVVAAAGGPEVGDLALFGVLGQESVELIIKEIQHATDFVAKITCVDHSPQVQQAENGAIPPFSSQITVPADLQQPPQPAKVSDPQTGLEAMMRNADGSLTATIMLTLAPYNFPLPLTPSVNIRLSGTTDFHAATATSQGNLVRILDVVSGSTYDLQVYYKNQSGMSSQPLLLPGVYVVGAEGAPDDVTGFTVNIVGDTAFLKWDPSPDIDVDHYYIKYSSDTSGADWSKAIDLVETVATPATAFQTPALTGTYLIKAVDILGNESDNAAPAVSTVATLQNFATVFTVQENPGFTGAKSNIEFDGTGIRLAAADTVDDWANVDTVVNVDIGDDGVVASGIYSFAGGMDLTAIKTARLNPTFSVQGVNFVDNVDTIQNVDAVQNVDSTVDPSSWSLTLQVRTSNDNVTWSAWMDFVIGDYTCRYLEFQALFQSTVYGVSPYVTALKIDASLR